MRILWSRSSFLATTAKLTSGRLSRVPWRRPMKTWKSLLWTMARPIAAPEIAQRFPVRYIRQPNRGLCASRNVGIQESRGRFLIFLDADDRLKPEAAEAGLRVLAERPNCAMAVGDHIFVSENGRHLSDSRKECFSSAHYEALLKSNFIEMISSVLFRRTCFRPGGGIRYQASRSRGLRALPPRRQGLSDLLPPYRGR